MNDKPNNKAIQYGFQYNKKHSTVIENAVNQNVARYYFLKL